MRLRDHPLMSYQGIVKLAADLGLVRRPRRGAAERRVGNSEIGAIVKDGSSQ